MFTHQSGDFQREPRCDSPDRNERRPVTDARKRPDGRRVELVGDADDSQAEKPDDVQPVVGLDQRRTGAVERERQAERDAEEAGDCTRQHAVEPDPVPVGLDEQPQVREGEPADGDALERRAQSEPGPAVQRRGGTASATAPAGRTSATSGRGGDATRKRGSSLKPTANTISVAVPAASRCVTRGAKPSTTAGNGVHSASVP